MAIWLILFLGHAEAAEPRYRLQFTFSGSAQGRILFFIPFRFYFETGAGLELWSERTADGEMAFRLDQVTEPAYLLRTLGFAGKALVMVTAFTDYQRGDEFAQERIEAWHQEQPDFSRYIRKVKKLPFMVENRVAEAFTFRRSASGVFFDSQTHLELRYKHHPQDIGIYFRVYAILDQMLSLFNHGVWPANAPSPPQEFPSEWMTLAMDLSSILNRVGAQVEKIVASAVKFNQEDPFVMKYHMVRKDRDRIDIEGRNTQKPFIWRSYWLDEFLRKTSVRSGDGVLLRDELNLLIRGHKGIAGQGRLLLELIDQDN